MSVSSAKVGEHLRSNVVGYIALFIAMTGTAIANVSTNSVASRHIVNGSVKSVDLKNDQVKSIDVRDASLTVDDIAPNSIGRTEIDQSSLCPPGTMVHAGACIETGSARAATTHRAAALDCADSGGRLPNPGELLAFARDGHTSVTEMTGDVTGFTSAVHIKTDTARIDGDTSVNTAYRCVFSPVL